MRTAGIVGLGLIGGSLARDLAAAGWRVQGADRDPMAPREAREAGVIEGPIRPEQVDVLVLAVPVLALPRLLRRLAPEYGAAGPGRRAVVTDTGSTKRSVMAAAARAGLAARFVGAHPMAGDDRSGWSASRAGLFEGAIVHLCPGTAGPDAVRRVASMWEAAGGRARPIDPAVHDGLLAHASHLPQLAASAIALALADAGVGAGELGPGGRDVTRLAGSDPGVWTDIVRDNADAVGPALERLIDALTAFRDAVARDDDELGALLEAARRWRYADGPEDPVPGRSTPRIRGDVGGKNASSR